MDDIVEALYQLVHTTNGASKITALLANKEDEIEEEIENLFGIHCQVPDPQGRDLLLPVTFTAEDLRAAGFQHTKCTAVVEGRPRVRRR
jgi:hypothetical protein